MMGMEPRGSRVRRSRRCGLLRRSASVLAGRTRTKTNAGLVAVVAVFGLILAGCGGTTDTVTSPTASPKVSCATGGGAANTCVVGDMGPGGGKVFWVLEGWPTGLRYMEAAPNTWNGGSSDPRISWCSTGPNGKKIPGADEIGIGFGKVNTDDMVAACTSGAANSVRAYTGGGKSDWFLPSKDELNELYKQKTTVDGFAAGDYWSSSQQSKVLAWLQNFVGGNEFDINKDDHFYVRPIRAF